MASSWGISVRGRCHNYCVERRQLFCVKSAIRIYEAMEGTKVNRGTSAGLQSGHEGESGCPLVASLGAGHTARLNCYSTVLVRSGPTDREDWSTVMISAIAVVQTWSERRLSML